MNKETADVMQGAAEKLDRHFNGDARGKDRKTGFIIIAYPFGDGERPANYITNGDQVLPVVERLAERLRTRAVQ